MARTVACPPSGSRSQTTICAPSVANSSAVARPMPEPAPVIRATLPATSPGACGGFGGHFGLGLGGCWASVSFLSTRAMLGQLAPPGAPGHGPLPGVFEVFGVDPAGGAAVRRAGHRLRCAACFIGNVGHDLHEFVEIGA